jgi:AcrR family transcriptional regulator
VKEKINITEKQEQLLNIAEKLFAEKGFDAVSVRDLAKEANVNIAMISYYFGSKEKMYATLIEDRISNTRNAILDIKSKKIAPFEKLTAIIDLYVDRLMSNPRFLKIMTHELYQQNRPTIKQTILKNFKKNQSEVMAILEDGLKAKIFKKVDLEMTFMTMLSTIIHVTSSCEQSLQVFNISSEEELYATKFKKRIKKHLAEMLSNHLLYKK